MTLTGTLHTFKRGKTVYEVRLTESFQVEIHREEDVTLAIKRTKIADKIPGFHWLTKEGHFTHEKALELLRKVAK